MIILFFLCCSFLVKCLEKEVMFFLSGCVGDKISILFIDLFFD